MSPSKNEDLYNVQATFVERLVGDSGNSECVWALYGINLTDHYGLLSLPLVSFSSFCINILTSKNLPKTSPLSFHAFISYIDSILQEKAGFNGHYIQPYVLSFCGLSRSNLKLSTRIVSSKF